MRIAAIVPDNGPNPLYRAIGPMQVLAGRGHSTRVYAGHQMPNVHELEGADVVCVWRMFHDAARWLVKALRERGVAVVWDNDDDMIARTPDHRRGRGGANAMIRQAVKREVTAMMKLADLITTPSTVLAERFSRTSGRPTRVVENYLLPGFRAPQAIRHEEARIVGWVAGIEHRRDFEQLNLREPLEKLMARFPNVHVATMGINFGLRSEKYYVLDSHPLLELPEWTRNFDIGIAPIADTSFNRGRSNIKLKEYAAVALPWLASPVGPYRDMGPAQGGLLVEDGDWYSVLAKLINDTVQRSTLGYAGLKWTKTQTLEYNAEKWEAVFEEAIERAAARRSAPA
jgi:glycosyltransferase involved in cell wall biosynthesis